MTAQCATAFPQRPRRTGGGVQPRSISSIFSLTPRRIFPPPQEDTTHVKSALTGGISYMKATGIVRRIDDLGRVVIPKEIRRTMRIREGDPWRSTPPGTGRSSSRSILSSAGWRISPPNSATPCPAALTSPPPSPTVTRSSPSPGRASASCWASASPPNWSTS